MNWPGPARGDPSDAILVEAASHGDLYAWERIVRRYQEPVFRLAYLVVRTTDLAEAATQSAFIRAYRALPSLEDSAGLLPWLFRIAAGEARQQRREAGRATSSSSRSDDSGGPHFPASAVPGLTAAAGLTPADREALMGSFDRLGEDDRLTIGARYLFELSRADAAAALSIGTALLEEHLTTALQHLRRRIIDQ